MNKVKSHVGNSLQVIQLSAHDLPKEATHPGEFLRDELEARAMSGRSLAQLIGVSPSLVSELINGKRGISVEMALRLERALGISAEFWMKAQTGYEIKTLRIKHREELAKINLPKEKKQSLSATI